MTQDPCKAHNPSANTKMGIEAQKENAEWLGDLEAAKRRDAVLTVMLNTAPKDQDAIRRGRRQNQKKADEGQKAPARKTSDP